MADRLPSRPRRATRAGRRPCAAVLAGLAVLAGCAAPAPPEPAPAPEYWTVSRAIELDPDAGGTVTLFDPAALAHHRADPPNWWHHDFAFAPDLATGRFAAVSTGRRGTLDVRVTEAPPSAREAAAAGPSAVQRLRVTDGRLLLAGGDAWPSVERPGGADPFDPRWIGVGNGDYRVTITALDDDVRDDGAAPAVAVDLGRRT